MIKKILSVLVTAVCLCLIPGPVTAGGKISLRLWGGWAYLAVGDVNAGTQAFFDWGKTYFAPSPGGTITGGYESIHWGYEFGGDVIFQLSPKLGVGIGAGYLQMSKDAPYPAMMTIMVDPYYGPEIEFTASTKISAIPIRASLFLSLPVSRKLDITAHAGISYYLQAEYHGDWFVAIPNIIFTGPFSSLTTAAEKKTAAIGLQGGLGVEYRFIRLLSLFLEAQGRYAKFKGFEGTSTSVAGDYGGVLPSFSETGKLYYESVPAVPGSPRWIMVQSAPPAGPGGQPREAAVDFSGVSFLVGVRIHF